MDTVEIPFLLENKIKRKVHFSVEGITIETMSGFMPDKFIPAETIAAFRYNVHYNRAYLFLSECNILFN